MGSNDTAIPSPACGEFHFVRDAEGGVRGVIAVDSKVLGPAAGGCRIWRYEDRDSLMQDAARLARGMSYKNAMAGLPFGGGKAVLQQPSCDTVRAELLKAFAVTVHNLKGQYVTAEDVGTSISDMTTIRKYTPYVAGLTAKLGKAGGDPSPWTAKGVFESMRAAVNWRDGRGLVGIRIAIQGVGNVGTHLCRLLHEAGAELFVADRDVPRARFVAQEFGARQISAEDILRVEADILAPCALGGVLNDETIPRLNVSMVIGAANNQLAADADGERLRAAGIIYAPDYVVNAGGIINVAAEYLGETTDQVLQRIKHIPLRMVSILKQARTQRRATNLVADEMAQKIITDARRKMAEAYAAAA